MSWGALVAIAISSTGCNRAGTLGFCWRAAEIALEKNDIKGICGTFSCSFPLYTSIENECTEEYDEAYHTLLRCILFQVPLLFVTAMFLNLNHTWYLSFVYTNVFWGLRIVYSKVRKLTQNWAKNSIFCVQRDFFHTQLTFLHQQR